MRGCPGLHIDGPAQRPPPSATGHLRDELERALPGTEVGEVQGRIGVHDADHGHLREIEPFGDHLRAQQDVNLPPRDALEDAVVRPFRAGRVEIHPGDPGFGKAQPEEVLELLGAEPAHALHLMAAGAASRRHGLLVAAIVAAQRRRRLMHGERDGAARALPDDTAGRALQVRGEAAPVEEQNHLFVPAERRLHRRIERLRPGDRAGRGQARRGAQVDHLDRREGPGADPLRQREDARPTGAREVQHFERRGRAAEDHPRALEPRAHLRDLARVVAR